MRKPRPYTLKTRAEAVESTRLRILHCARQALFSLPFDRVTLPEVAAHAGVTVQTVRNHFHSKEGLLNALAEQLSSDLLHARRTAAPTDSAEAAAMLAAEYELYGGAYTRLMTAVEASPALSAMAQRGRREHRRWLEVTFAQRLPSDPQRREHTLAALYAATDVGTWRLLRLDLEQSREATVDVLTTLIDGAFTGR